MNPSSAFLGKVRRFLQRHALDQARMVVAVSGGPDSVALLRALVTLRADASPPLVVAHLNHQLRADESDADEAFVRRLHAALAARGTPRLELRCDRIDVAARTQAEGSNLEDVARRLRYEWLGRVAQETGAAFLATGHTANDQAETILHRLVRGTGLQGLRGIALRRPLTTGVEIVRPLLEATRQELLDYLKAEEQDYRVDSSNFHCERTRNRIRHELLPLLARDYNPAIVSVLCHLAEQAKGAHAQEEEQAAALLLHAELPRANALLIFDRDQLRAAPRQLVREAFRLAWNREGWPVGSMGHREWDRLVGVAVGGISAVDLPGGVRARTHGRVVQVGRAS